MAPSMVALARWKAGLRHASGGRPRGEAEAIWRKIVAMDQEFDSMNVAGLSEEVTLESLLMDAVDDPNYPVVYRRSLPAAASTEEESGTALLEQQLYKQMIGIRFLTRELRDAHQRVLDLTEERDGQQYYIDEHNARTVVEDRLVKAWVRQVRAHQKSLMRQLEDYWSGEP